MLPAKSRALCIEDVNLNYLYEKVRGHISEISSCTYAVLFQSQTLDTYLVAISMLRLVVFVKDNIQVDK